MGRLFGGEGAESAARCAAISGIFFVLKALIKYRILAVEFCLSPAQFESVA